MDNEEQIINPNKRKITKLDADNKATETFNAEILREDEGENSESTLITLEKLTKGNWRDDDSLSFVKSELDEAPEAEDDFTTRIMSTKGGDIWLIPPQGKSKIKLNQAALSDEQLKNIDSVPNKANNTDLNTHVANKLNPHGVTPTQIDAEPAFATLPISKGGTGATTAEAARVNLGAVTDTEVVKLTGDQTIGGTKTFSIRPIISASTIDSDLNRVLSTLEMDKSQNGNFKFSNGLLIQWGHFTGSTNNLIITMPRPYTSTTSWSLSLEINETASSTTTVVTRNMGIITGAQTFQVGAGGSTIWRWIAVGY